jgi:hypothetical protein
MQKYLLMVSFIILTMPLYLSAHDQRTHQYIVVEGYKLLKNQLGDIPEMKDYIGTTQGRGDLQFQVPLVVGGAWAEDESDAVYGIGYKEGLLSNTLGFGGAALSTILGFPYGIPALLAAGAYGDVKITQALVSVTHFWDADNSNTATDNVVLSLSNSPYASIGSI